MCLSRPAVIAASILAAVAFGAPASAQTESVLYSFPKHATGIAHGRLLLGKTGALFGTTSGNAHEYFSKSNGAVFELTKSRGSWNIAWLHKFTYDDGSHSFARLVEDSTGALYGTTFAAGPGGQGTAFQLAPDGPETILHGFEGGSDGGNPFGGLMKSKGGRLYGTTEFGGTSGIGSVFELTPSGGTWTETILHSFAGRDGKYPGGDLIKDSSGALYGTTYEGGASKLGTIFELAKSGGAWSETILHNFGGSDGANPIAGLIEDSSGTFYGTTYTGGANGRGTVFSLIQSGGIWTEIVLYSFGGTDGAQPEGVLTLDPGGALYGTTVSGGSSGKGTVFELAKSGGSWTETVLHSFGYGTDGAYPDAGVTEDSSGNLFGTTTRGGVQGWGTVYEVVP